MLKNNLYIHKYFVIIFIAIVSIVLNSCFYNKENDNKKYDEEFFIKLTEYYNSNPDSALNSALNKETEFLENQDHLQLVRLYSFLSELYQYRKNDDYKALKYINKALDLFDKHPELVFDKTYIYINTGNILYRFQLYEEAIYVYRQIEKISDKFYEPQITSLVLNNIALSFEELSLCDSAKFYFDKTLQHIDNSGLQKDMLKIQYFNYISSLSLDCNNSDSIPFYFVKTQELFSKLDFWFDHCNFEQIKKYQLESNIDYYTNQVRAQSSMANYLISKNNYPEAIVFLQKATCFAKQINLITWYQILYSDLYTCAYMSDDFDLALKYIDTLAFYSEINNPNFKNLKDINEYYSKIYTKLNNPQLAENYNKLTKQYADSILLEKNSEEIISKKIELAVVPIQLSMKNIELGKIKQEQVIERQSHFIQFLIFGLIFIILILIVYYRLYKNLKNTQQELAYKTIKNIKGTDVRTKAPNKMTDITEANLIEKFETEIVIAKAFLDADLSLSLVADKLNSNRSYISVMVNKVYGMSFNDYINKLRIEESCQKIINNTNPNFTIDHLYSEVGFSGKSTFYNAFKKYVGVTPAVFFRLNSQI